MGPKVITDGYYEGETILLDEITCTYLQEPDCTESQDADSQSITISSRDGGGGKFLNIKTNNWSVDTDLKSLTVVLEDFKTRMNYGSENNEQ